MIANICMIAKDRPRLTQQALESLKKNTHPGSYNLTVIDDASEMAVDRHWTGENGTVYRLAESQGIVGFVRNFSIDIAERHWGRGDILYLSDNDIYFQPNWLEKMIRSFETCEPHGLRVLGGVRHPYHGINLKSDDAPVVITDAVAGYSHLMRWETWDKYGLFDAHTQGVCQSEDFAFCQKIIKDGGLVGYIEPGVIYNCGLTNSLGQPAVGGEAFPRVEGIIQE